MSENSTIWCALLPCSSEQRWAVPKTCLGEIVTITDATDQPPESIWWRGHDVPVLDLGAEDPTPWCEKRSGNGLIAVILGLQGETAEYWAIALRGGPLGVRELQKDDLIDAPDDLGENASAAFLLDDVLYQVPDLPRWQERATTPSSDDSDTVASDTESQADANRTG